MDANELWEYAVHRALTLVEGDAQRKLIQKLLDQAGGDVDAALCLCVRPKGAPFDYTAPGEILGNWGSSGPGMPRIECRGTAPATPIRAWGPRDHWNRPPDLVIQWREVFEYVRDGARRPLQLRLPL